MEQRELNEVEKAMLNLNTESSYEKHNLNLFVGKEYDNGFEIDFDTAVSIVKSEAPSMLRGSTVSFTLDTVGNTTMLFAKNAKGIVEYTVKLETSEHRTEIEVFDMQDTVSEISKESKNYKRIGICAYILFFTLGISALSLIYLITSIVR